MVRQMPGVWFLDLFIEVSLVRKLTFRFVRVISSSLIFHFFPLSKQSIIQPPRSSLAIDRGLSFQFIMSWTSLPFHPPQMKNRKPVPMIFFAHCIQMSGSDVKAGMGSSGRQCLISTTSAHRVLGSFSSPKIARHSSGLRMGKCPGDMGRLMSMRGIGVKCTLW
jgi:hypothetical protein